MTPQIKKAFHTFNKRPMGSSDDYRLKSILNLAGLDETDPAAVLAVVIDKVQEDFAGKINVLEERITALERKRE